MIELKNVTKTYNYKKSNAYEALHNISLKITDGELVAIIGTSGSGKSTLIHILGCVDSFEQGTYLMDGKDISKCSESQFADIRNKKIGIVVQDFALVENYSVLENVMLPFFFNRKISISSARKCAMKVLQQVGMDTLVHKSTSKLSGGQKQRVAIARAIVNSPSVILADEPTGALDSKTSAEIMALFKLLNEKGNTVIIVTHDPSIAEQADRIIRIEDGRII